MSTFRKILLYAGMVIAIIMLALSLAGIILAWYYNTPMTETALKIVVPATEVLGRVETLAGNTSASLQEISTGLTEAEQRVQEIGDNVNEANLIVEAISAIVGEDITPQIEAIRESVRSIYDTLGAVQGAIAAFNAIPFMDIEVPGEQELDELQTSMEEIALQVREVNDAVRERKEEIVGGAVDRVSEPLIRADTRVDESQVRWAELEVRTKEAKEKLLYVQENVASWIDLTSIVITIILIWVILSQVAVFILCRKYLQGKVEA